MIKELGGKSAEAVTKATGKNWNQWIKLLDKGGMKDKDHTHIAEWVYKHYGDEAAKDGVSGWWAQSITVGYEYHHGKRKPGQTKEAGYQVGVQKTCDLSPAKAWEFLMSPTGLGIWLGEVDDFAPFAGYAYRTKAGISGEIRTVDKNKRLRLTWKLPEWRNVSTVQVYLLPTKAKTAILFHQEKLAGSAQRKLMADHWQAILDKLIK
jgi:uncharacterized protein YndB with AHSA1/START domain